jgi:hypothetical protein
MRRNDLVPVADVTGKIVLLDDSPMYAKISAAVAIGRPVQGLKR